MRWEDYIDKFGTGWAYDVTTGHREESADSPVGIWLGMLMVPTLFATQAAAAFEDKCSILTDAEAKTFYEEKVSVYQDSEIVNHEILLAIKTKQDMGKSLTTEQTNALDPAHPQPGIRNNPVKTWAGIKAVNNITVVEAP
jgi:hypothetical protein